MSENMNDLNFKEEISKMEYEPLDDTEKRLVAWSLGLGIFLLVALYLISDWMFPGAHGV